MKKKSFNENAAIRGVLRRLFARSPAVREALLKVRREVPKHNKDGSRSKKDAVQYLCAVCNTWTKSTAVSVDHINPVVDVNGFVDWNTFVTRLFCDSSNLQVICDNCHNEKTNAERVARLLIQYTKELDFLELSLIQLSVNQVLITNDRLLKLKKDLSRYIAKKNTIGLEIVVQRAQELKNRLEKLNKRSKNV